MKRTITFAALLISAVILAGCGGKNKPAPPTAPAAHRPTDGKLLGAAFRCLSSDLEGRSYLTEVVIESDDPNVTYDFLSICEEVDGGPAELFCADLMKIIFKGKPTTFNAAFDRLPKAKQESILSHIYFEFGVGELPLGKSVIELKKANPALHTRFEAFLQQGLREGWHKPQAVPQPSIQ
ncbi:MAG: hypothetical protein HN370_07255 [Phycisphaerales bacterium]|mgnify:CR=1 FL=1|jgi:hypothetical protein|nr:hypothetical protein [Phycisphaerales bacterium]